MVCENTREVFLKTCAIPFTDRGDFVLQIRFLSKIRISPTNISYALNQHLHTQIYSFEKKKKKKKKKKKNRKIHQDAIYGRIHGQKTLSAKTKMIMLFTLPGC